MYLKNSFFSFFSLLLLLISFEAFSQKTVFEESKNQIDKGVFLIVLGTIQDAGSPHVACEKECCKSLFVTDDSSRKVVSLGIVDFDYEKTYLFEATPDITNQLRDLRQTAGFKITDIPDGVFLTHAHTGHYTGLMYLGKEATNAKKVPVYTMPKMKVFLEENGPWGQLVNNENIVINSLENEKEMVLTPNLKVIPFTVPHRDEYSETVGYEIIGKNKSALFIPDIDKWEKWKTDIVSEIKKVDYAFLDATFYNSEEVNNRDISEIPHPFVIESMELFKNLPPLEMEKIHFIHFNHTNPLLNPESQKAKAVLKNGFQIARLQQQFKL